jgi:hypothetical protein
MKITSLPPLLYCWCLNSRLVPFLDRCSATWATPSVLWLFSEFSDRVSEFCLGKSQTILLLLLPPKLLGFQASTITLACFLGKIFTDFFLPFFFFCAPWQTLNHSSYFSTAGIAGITGMYHTSPECFQCHCVSTQPSFQIKKYVLVSVYKVPCHTPPDSQEILSGYSSASSLISPLTLCHLLNSLLHFLGVRNGIIGIL